MTSLSEGAPPSIARIVVRLGVLAALVNGSAFARAAAQDTTRSQAVRIGLTYTPGTRPGVLVIPVAGANADSIRAIITRDLDFGDRIVALPAPEGGEPLSGLLNYPMFAQLGAAAIVQASVTPAGSLHVAVHDVAAARVLNVGDFALPQPPLGADWRMAVHGASDEIERWITAQRGVAQTRIIFERAGSLWIVDSDGAEAHAVPGTLQAQSPAWHPSGRQIAFAQRADDASLQVMLRDLGAGTTRRISSRGGTNTSPTFSPDGATLAYSAGLDGADLYAVSPASKEPAQRLTVGPGSSANQMPSFSPDGKRIVYMSDRLGHPEVYIMDADGTNADLLTTATSSEKPYRLNPSWSPDGRRIVYESQVKGISQLMLISPRDRSVTPLTNDGENEAPSWAADARHLVFSSTRGGSQQLWILDVDSGRVRQLTHGPRARRAAWSPRLDALR